MLINFIRQGRYVPCTLRFLRYDTRYFEWRKVAVVLVLVAAAFITPSTDVFTMCLVALPLWVLFELSVLVVRRVEPRTQPAP